MKKEHIITTVILLIVWQILAIRVHNDIFIPYPKDVVLSILEILSKKESYTAILLTIGRVGKGFLISLLVAIILSILACEYKTIFYLLEPLTILTKTIPNISYIVIAIIWLGSEGAVSAVTFLILFPIFYNAFINHLEDEEKKTQNISILYEETFFKKLKLHIFPSLFVEILRTGKTAFSMGLKVAIMAEIIGAVRYGIGKQMNYARINLNTADIFAWTIIVILISLLFDLIFQKLIDLNAKRETQ